MCGIAGWVGRLPGGARFADLAAQALSHRGPDGSSAYVSDVAGLVHTRLRVIDITERGTQPMSNEDRSVFSVFNGEIYNHRQLRGDLAARGHVFTGHCDGEVIPHLYEEFGPEFVSLLRGMFALAVIDTRRGSFLLARDRFGIKPLFYSRFETDGGPCVAFASEIGPLRTLPGIDIRVNEQALLDYLALTYVPGPDTLFRGIHAVNPGVACVGLIHDGGASTRPLPFARWSISPDHALAEDLAAEICAERLSDAVRGQLEADVPMGALLSGGIDSSLVSSFAQAGSGGGLDTFNVQFPVDSYDETWAATMVSSHIGSRHKTLRLPAADGDWDTVSSLLRSTGQPFADTSLFAVHAISRLMKEHVTVALSGDGGDEAFGGYDAFWRSDRVAQMQQLPSAVWSVGSGLLRRSWSDRARRVGTRLSDLARADDTAIVQDMLSWVRPSELRALAEFARDSDLLPIRRHFEPLWEYHNSSSQSALNSRRERLSAHLTEVWTRLTLPNDFLFKVDHGSMQASLEVRVPFLDEELWDFALTLPRRLKTRRRTGKVLLRRVAQTSLPRAVAEKPKAGFSIPVDSWLTPQCKVAIGETLLCGSPIENYLNRQSYGPLVKAFCAGESVPGVSREGLYQRIIMFLSLHLCLAT